MGIEELVKLARLSGVGAIAITDHDTFAGAVRGKVIGKRYGVDVIPGAEISCFDRSRGKKVHLLCYLCDKPDRLEVVLHTTGESRKKANNLLAQKIHRRYPFCSELLSKHVSGSTNLYRQHILHALMDAGYTDRIYGDLYDELFCEGGELCAVGPEYPDVFEVLELIRSAGGLAVLAHPTMYGNLELLPELIEKGLDGVEARHPGMSDEDTGYLTKIAESSGLLMTGGSDFHGMYSARPIRVGDVSVPDEQVKKLYQLKAASRRRA